MNLHPCLYQLGEGGFLADDVAGWRYPATEIAEAGHTPAKTPVVKIAGLGQGRLVYEAGYGH